MIKIIFLVVFIFYFYTQYKNKNKIIKYIEDKIDFSDFIKKNNINYVYVSNGLKLFEKRVREKYKLKEYKPYSRGNALFFGLYSTKDLEVINKHKYSKFIMFGGSDVDSDLIYKLNKCNFISISENIKKRLLNRNSQLVEFNLVDNNLFFPQKNNNSESVFIYNGYNKGLEKNYGKEIYEQVMKEMPEYNYILSNNLKLPYEKMPEIYSKCFIGLRLTKKDGNANTVQEFEAMEIPIIHNFSNYGIKWNDIEDIKRYLKKIKVK